MHLPTRKESCRVFRWCVILSTVVYILQCLNYCSVIICGLTGFVVSLWIVDLYFCKVDDLYKITITICVVLFGDYHAVWSWFVVELRPRDLTDVRSYTCVMVGQQNRFEVVCGIVGSRQLYGLRTISLGTKSKMGPVWDHVCVWNVGKNTCVVLTFACLRRLVWLSEFWEALNINLHKFCVRIIIWNVSMQ